MMEQEKDEATK